VPDAEHPQPGCDTFLSGARVVVRINATEEETPVTLSGLTQIVRENKPSDKDGDGLDEVNTEMVYMQLEGGGITVSESPTVASIGKIEEQENDVPGELEFPANSYFDVFFEVDVDGLILHNDEAFRVECKIEEIPPYACLYVPPVPDPIELLNDDEEKIATLLHGLHLPQGPKQVLVIFSNAEKDTPTPTATGAATATPTSTPGAPTTPTATVTATATPPTPPPPTAPPPTATATPTTRPPTATPTPPRLCGDLNKDGRVNSLDALLFLQWIAGFIPSLPNAGSADANGDGRFTSVDVALILQIDARIIPRCPAA
jgi:hypothetical protein